MRIARPLGGLALAAVAILGALLVAEGTLTALGIPPAPNDDLQVFVEYDSLRGWRNVENGNSQLVTPEFTVPLRYNERGYRGPLHDYAKPVGAFRLLLLGDSYLEGYTVRLEDRVAEVAQATLDHDNPPGGVEVIALGTSGYSTDQELLWLESEGVQYQPDLVVLLFYENDYWYNIRGQYPLGAKPLFRLTGDSLTLSNAPVPRTAVRSQGWRDSLERLLPGPKRLLARHSHLYWLAKRAFHRSPLLQALGSRLGKTPPGAEAGAPGADRTLVPEEFSLFADSLSPPADSSLTMTARLLSRMQRRVQAAGGSFLVLYVPSNPAVYPPGSPQSARYFRRAPYGKPERYSERFSDLCQRAGVSCLDPTPRFQAVAESLHAGRRLLVFPEDGHWDENGHRLAGQILTDVVRAALSGPRP